MIRKNEEGKRPSLLQKNNNPYVARASCVDSTGEHRLLSPQLSESARGGNKMAITGPVIVRAAESQNDHEKRRRKAAPRRFPTSRIFLLRELQQIRQAL
jgi:hypothetical protein